MSLTVGTLILALAGILVHRFLAGTSGPGPRGRDKTAGGQRSDGRRFGVRDVMIIVVTVLVLVSGLYVILSKSYDDATQKWAFASIGAIIGFWLSHERA